MAIEHPEKPFERYADDMVVHCKTEKQAKFMLRAIEGVQTKPGIIYPLEIGSTLTNLAATRT